METPRSVPDASISFPMLGDWTINPKRFILIGNFEIYWYAIIIATGFLLAVLYASKRARQFGLTSDNILDVILLGVPLAIVCARIYYVAFEWDNYKNDLMSIFAIRDGGLGMYGVLIGAILGMVIYTKYKKIPLRAMLDLVCIGFLIGQSLGRWGNFMNREAFGRETDIFCRMVLTRPNGQSYSVHPTFLYESLWNFAGFLLLHFLSKKRRYDGEVFLMYLCWYGCGRMLIEGLRTDSLMIPHTNIRVSQLVSLVLFVTAGALLLYHRLKAVHDPKDLYVNRKRVLEAEAAETAEASNGAEAQKDAEDASTKKAVPQSECSDDHKPSE